MSRPPLSDRHRKVDSVNPNVKPTPRGIYVGDTSMLLNEVVQAQRLGRLTGLLMALDGGAARLFVAPHVLTEFEEEIPGRLRADDDLDAVMACWRKWYLPRIRVVTVPDGWGDEEMSVRTLMARDASDAATVRLAVALSPCILLAEDRDFGGAETGRAWLSTINPIAAANQLNELVDFSTLAATILVRFAIAAMRTVPRLSPTTQFVAGVAVAAAMKGVSRSSAGLSLRKVTRDLVEQTGSTFLKTAEWARDQTSIDEHTFRRMGRPTLGERMARCLASGEQPLTTTELTKLLFGLSTARNLSVVRSEATRWPATFIEVRRGRWELGRPGADERPLPAMKIADYKIRFHNALGSDRSKIR